MYNQKIEHSTKKSQTATEYIVIVAVVIVIALVLVQIMGGFPGIGSSTSKKVSDYKLSSSDQIGIEKYYFGTGSALFSLKNNYFESLRVENLTINGIICDFNNTNISGTNSVGLPLTLNPGQSVTLNCSSSNFSKTQNDATPQVSVTYTNPTTGATYTSTLGSSTATLGSASENQTQNIVQNVTVNDLRLGLVAYYAFDGNTSDESGKGNDGTNYGANYTTSGKVGGAYKFDGINDYINISDNPSLDFTNNQDFVVNVWVNTSNSAYMAIVSKDVGTDLKSWWIRMTSEGKVQFLVADGNTHEPNLISENIVSDGLWHMITVVRNTSDLVIYFDGIYSNKTIDTTDQGSENSNPVRIGAFNNNNYYFNGSIDEVAIYNRSLSQTEISYLYNNGSGQSLYLGGAQAPACAVNQTSCLGTNYITCSNGSTVNNGDVSGQCGYFDLTALRTGLVANYALDGNTSDGSGNNNIGNNSGANYTTSGKVGGAYQFNGVNNYINLGNNLPLRITGNISISAWFKTASSSTQMIIAKDDNTNRDWRIYLGSGQIIWDIWRTTVNKEATSTLSNYNDNQWHQVVCNNDGTDLNIYIDGIKVSGATGATKGGSIDDGIVNVTIGIKSDFTFPFNGSIDELQIYNRSLSASEISYLYNNGTGRSLSLGGAQTPVCAPDQFMCNGASYVYYDGNLVGMWNLEKSPGLSNDLVMADSGQYNNLGIMNGKGFTKQNSGNPILSLGTSDKFDSVYLYTGSGVLYDGTSYKMWYTGKNSSASQTGYATSPDGLTWTKQNSGNPVLTIGAAGKFDAASASAPSVLFDGTTYKMWYAGNNGSNLIQIGYATSPDGITWTKQNSGNPVVTVGSTGKFDSQYASNPSVIFNGGIYQMWYGGWNNSNWQIGYATSNDGLTWTKQNSGNPIWTYGGVGSMDYVYATNPNVFYSNGIYHMWHTGNNGSLAQIGHATSNNGITWIKQNSGKPVLSVSAGKFDSVNAQSPDVIFNGTGYQMWYAGNNGSNLQTGYATLNSPFTTGKNGYGINFDGADDYIALNSLNSYTPNYPMTLSAWVKLNTITPTWGGRIIAFSNGSASSDIMSIFYNHVNQRFMMQVTTNSVSDSLTDNTSSAPTVGQWYHITGVFKNDTYRALYVNGVAVNISTNTKTRPYTDTAYIGGMKWVDNLIQVFNGTIDDAKIWNRTLTDNEILYLYLNGT